jgi:hypothetical protein
MELTKDKYIYDLNENTLFVTENSNNIITEKVPSEHKEDFYYLSDSSNILNLNSFSQFGMEINKNFKTNEEKSEEYENIENDTKFVELKQKADPNSLGKQKNILGLVIRV